MKIAYVISEVYAVCQFNGVRVQAQTWADELIKKGHELIFVNPWVKHSWKDYDIVHIFGPVHFIRSFVETLKTENSKQVIVYSPIIDTNQAIWKYKLISYAGCDKLRLSTHQYNVRKAKPFINHWLVRSQYELSYVNKAYDVPVENISIVPLSFRIPTIDYYPQKENFCLHVSTLCEGRKNVMRLIDAAIKYNFRLILAGSITEEEFAPFRVKIEANNNIEYLGRISDEELIDLYKRAKVFALPSLYEGVGMVAVEAAAYGDDIVVTQLGGPKEYYSDMSFIVNPYSIDDIGSAVMEAFKSTTRQPSLMQYVINNYNISHCVDLLLQSYNMVRHHE